VAAWAAHVAEAARAGFFADELPHWRRVAAGPAAALPLDRAAPETLRLAGGEAHVAVAFDEDDTHALLQQRRPAAGAARLDVLLLAALAHAMSRWIGGGSLLVDVESHGRGEPADAFDLTRTVGWFTAIYPLRLALDAASPIGDHVARVREARASVPRGGRGFLALAALADDEETRGVFRSMPRADVLFNYLGRLDAMWGGGFIRGRAAESCGPTRSPRNRRTHLLEVNAFAAGGRLHVDWSFDAALHDAATIRRLADDFAAALRALAGTGARQSLTAGAAIGEAAID